MKIYGTLKITEIPVLIDFHENDHSHVLGKMKQFLLLISSLIVINEQVEITFNELNEQMELTSNSLFGLAYMLEQDHCINAKILDPCNLMLELTESGERQSKHSI